MKKRMLAVLTTLAMLISMCSISVYAEDPVEVSDPQVYNYTVRTNSGYAHEYVTGSIYGKSGGDDGYCLINYKADYLGVKPLYWHENGATSTDKTVSSGQTIKLSFRAAWASLKNDTGLIFPGIEFDSKVYLQIYNKDGKFVKLIGPTFVNEVTMNEIPAYDKNWVMYDLVLKYEGNLDAKLSLYCDGKPMFENEAVTLTKEITKVVQPNIRFNASSKTPVYLDDVSLTIYPENYEGTIVEENPLVLTDNFIREDDGTIVYKGTKAFSNADSELVTKEGWFAQYYNGYIRVRKGTTESSVIYYYEKAMDRVQNFDIADMTVNPGTKEWTVEVKNTEANPINPVVFLASYSGNEMVKCTRSEDVTIQPGKTGNLTVNLTVAEEENVDKIKIFLFGSVGELGPWKKADATTKVATE